MPTLYKPMDVVVFRTPLGGQVYNLYYVPHVGEECVLVKRLGLDEWQVCFPTPFNGRMRDDVYLPEKYMSAVVLEVDHL